MVKTVDLSVIVVSYNTKELTKQTLDSIQQSFSLSPDLTYEIIIIDNNSHDGSFEMLSSYKPRFKRGSIVPIQSKKNIGFGPANNLGIKKAKGRYILLLNSDMIADKVRLDTVLSYLDKHNDVGVLTVKVNLKKKGIDPASHRGFPTPWRSLCYFSKLEKLTERIPVLNRLFGGYHLTHRKLTRIHEIDSPTAAFWISPAHVLKDMKGFDEDYFMYGEDIDLAYRIKENGYKVVYYPRFSVTHLKYQSGLNTKKKKTQSITTYHFYNAMKIFYDKHFAPKYPKFLRALIHKAIDVKYWLATL